MKPLVSIILSGLAMGIGCLDALWAQNDGSATKIRTVSAEILQTVRSVYQYNLKASARLDTVATDSGSTSTRQRIVLWVTNRPPVPAFLALPRTANAAVPLVVLIHGYSDSKAGWLASGLPDSLIAQGLAVLALDAPFHGERMSEGGYRLPASTDDLRELAIQWTIEHRRFLDVLSTRKDLDLTRLGIVGYSMGTLVSFALTGVDARPKVVVAAVAPIGVATDNAVVTVAPQTFAGAVHTPILLLMARHDSYYTVEQANQFFGLIPAAQKDLALFESGHILPPEWTSRATSWLVRFLH